MLFDNSIMLRFKKGLKMTMLDDDHPPMLSENLDRVAAVHLGSQNMEVAWRGSVSENMKERVS